MQHSQQLQALSLNHTDNVARFGVILPFPVEHNTFAVILDAINVY